MLIFLLFSMPYFVFTVVFSLQLSAATKKDFRDLTEADQSKIIRDYLRRQQGTADSFARRNTDSVLSVRRDSNRQQRKASDSRYRRTARDDSCDSDCQRRRSLSGERRVRESGERRVRESGEKRGKERRSGEKVGEELETRKGSSFSNKEIIHHMVSQTKAHKKQIRWDFN